MTKVFYDYDHGDLGVSSSQMSNAMIKHVEVPLTAAEILAINTSPKTIVPGETGTVHLFLEGLVVYEFGTVAFTTAHNATFFYTNASGDACSTASASAFLGGADRVVTVKQLTTDLTSASATFLGQALVFSASADPSGTATADGTARIHCWYRTIKTRL